MKDATATLDPVREALQYVEKLKSSTQELEKRVADLQKRIQNLQKEESRLIPVEHEAGVALNQKIKELGEELESLKIQRQYPLLHLKEVLNWRDQRGLPKFAVFNIRKPQIIIHYNGEKIRVLKDTFREEVFPEIIQQAFQNFPILTQKVWTQRILFWLNWAVIASLSVAGLFYIIQLKHTGLIELGCAVLIASIVGLLICVYITFEYLNNKISVSANCTASFRGVIPEKVRENIRVATGTFGNDIFILTAAPQWQLNTDVEIKPRDPLVIGIKGSKAYLVDVFDLTPLEEYLRREFTS